MSAIGPMQRFDSRQLKAPGKTWTMKSAGDVGDAIFGMPVMRHYGKVIVYLEAANYTRVPLTPANWRGIDRILKAQPYIADVLEWKRENVDVNLNDFRATMFRFVRNRHHIDRHIADWTAMACNLPTTIKDEPWLTIPDPVTVAPVVISRSGPGRPAHAVYHGNAFPWGQALKKYSKNAVFVGTELEHEVFQAQFGDIHWHQTPSLYEVAQVIAGCQLFLGNQSSPNAIAQGLGTPAILEVWGNGPNCLHFRKNSQNVWDHKANLPDL